MNEIVAELEPLQFFDLPGFYKKFDEWYESSNSKKNTPEHRLVNAIYLGCVGVSDAYGEYLSNLYHETYDRNDAKVTEHFLSQMIAPEWRADVETHIQQIQQQYP